MCGYASNETDVLMPAPITFAHRLVQRQAEMRKMGVLPWLRPDAKSQVTFRYQDNTATLHTDSSVMPRTKRAWSSWNYQLVRGAEGRIEPATHYWMNSLQGVSDRSPFFVSINRPDDIDPTKLHRRIDYAHPLFDLPALQAQEEIPTLNANADSTTHTYFVGAWQRYGFHEDGLLSAYNLCHHLLGRDPWQS